MELSLLDWAIIAVFFLCSLLIGLWASRSSGKSSSEFFLSGRSMPWWLLGVSMVATTFSADTPNLVTDIVRKNGVAGNWVWWAFLLTGMLTVFVYARLWRRSGVMTDLEFYELRYSGKAAAFLRGFRALYLGVFFNVLVMAAVCLAAIKIGGVLLDLAPWQSLLFGSLITVIYSVLGGLRGILYTDFFQFGLAMVGTVAAAVVIVNLPEVGGLENLLAHPQVRSKTSILPDFQDSELVISLMVVPLAVQWWASYYPGAEPGGGGYIAQRMLAAKDEQNAMGATLLFNIAHYALRPWPWILIALASLIVFPDIDALKEAYPNFTGKVDDDMAYPAMLNYLPSGLLGLVIASLLGAFMSTISTHLNWGSSYIVHDWYLRFYRPDASEQEQVRVGRISTVLLMIAAALIALLLQNALRAFDIILLVGAGTGLLFILRWFWWRISAYSELAALIISFFVAIYLEFIHPQLGFEALAGHTKLLTGVGLTTAGWILATLLTPATDEAQLIRFYKKIRPAEVGWKKVIASGKAQGLISDQEKPLGQLPLEILGMLLGCFAVYGALFATGYYLYGQYSSAAGALAMTVVCSVGIFWIWGKVNKAKN